MDGALPGWMPGDRDIIAEIVSLVPEATDRVLAMPDEYLEIDDPLIIMAAWGPRITTRRTRGMDLQAYPSRIGATRKLWLDWIGSPKTRVGVVIAKKKAQARIDAAMGTTHSDPEMVQSEPLADITQDEIDDMMQERMYLRAAKDFDGADKIRDYLTRHGVVFSDQKVTP